MENKQSLAPHHLLRAGIAAGLSLYIVRLYKSDALIYYIAPKMNNYIKYAAVALIVIAIYQGYQAITAIFDQTPSCGCGHPKAKSWARSIVFYLLFLIPITCGYFVPDSVMGSAVAAKKGVNLTNVMNIKPRAAEATTALSSPTVAPSAIVGGTNNLPPQTANTSQNVDDEKLKALFKTDKYDEDFAKLAMKLYKKDNIVVQEEGFMEIIQSISIFMDPFVGKPIELKGFVYRADDMKNDQFVVSRFSISCCSADATPFGLMVESPMAKNFPKDTWVNVTGTIHKTTYEGNEILKIDASKIEKVAAPKTPYVYPNYDYLDKADP